MSAAPMPPTRPLRVKVCCISTVEEARLAVALGADAVGLVSAMPSGPGVIGDQRIAEIARTVPPPVARFLLTSRREADAITAQAHAAGADTLQLVDRVAPEVYEHLRTALPAIRLVQVVHVTGEESVAEAEAAARYVDAVLLDSGDPALAVPELGGTGRVHDWSLSARIRAALDVPVFLAGGLHAGNVVQAVRTVRPFGVDVCSGVRTEGRLDRAKLDAFVQEARRTARPE